MTLSYQFTTIYVHSQKTAKEHLEKIWNDMHFHQKSLGWKPWLTPLQWMHTGQYGEWSGGKVKWLPAVLFWSLWRVHDSKEREGTWQHRVVLLLPRRFQKKMSVNTRGGLLCPKFKTLNTQECCSKQGVLDRTEREGWLSVFWINT